MSDFSWIGRLIQQGGSIAALPVQFASSLSRFLGININLLNPAKMTYVWEEFFKKCFFTGESSLTLFAFFIV